MRVGRALVGRRQVGHGASPVASPTERVKPQRENRERGPSTPDFSRYPEDSTHFASPAHRSRAALEREGYASGQVASDGRFISSTGKTPVMLTEAATFRWESVLEREEAVRAILSCVALAGLLLVPSMGQAQQACQGASYEAESMFHSTGGSTLNGWNIWSNGYISTTHDFDGGSKVITVIARGQSAGGAAPAHGPSPHMTVYLDGNYVYSYSVIPSDWTAYTFNWEVPAGVHEIQIHFDNDFFQPGQDRNLFVDKLMIGCGGGWTNLTLRNGWRPAADSNVPAVGLIDGIVTFRGALDGTDATSNNAFCLSDGHTSAGPDYTQYRPSDVGILGVRAALANGASGSLHLGLPQQELDPSLPSQELIGSSCMNVDQHGESSPPGPDAREFTSLEGVTYTKSAFSPRTALKVELGAWQILYPLRGSDGLLPDGQGAYVQLNDGFVRFLGEVVSTVGGAESIDPVLFTLPPGQGLIPNEPVRVPVSLSPLSIPQAGRIVIQPNGDVILEGPSEAARAGVSLDGTAYSVSSPASALPIALSDGWSASSSRAVRARLANGIVRLEGAVRNGTTATLGTLPAGMQPAKAILVVADALLLAQPATLRIDTDGSIEVVSPTLVVAQPGISLDGVSFALDLGFQCTAACLNATPLVRQQNSGSFGTTGERWFVVSQNINGWQASEMAGRTIRVNGTPVTPGQMPLPAAVNGSYYFQFSAGNFDWASWSFW